MTSKEGIFFYPIGKCVVTHLKGGCWIFVVFLYLCVHQEKEDLAHRILLPVVVFVKVSLHYKVNFKKTEKITVHTIAITSKHIIFTFTSEPTITVPCMSPIFHWNPKKKPR